MTVLEGSLWTMIFTLSRRLFILEEELLQQLLGCLSGLSLFTKEDK